MGLKICASELSCAPIRICELFGLIRVWLCSPESGLLLNEQLRAYSCLCMVSDGVNVLREQEKDMFELEWPR